MKAEAFQDRETECDQRHNGQQRRVDETHRPQGELPGRDFPTDRIHQSEYAYGEGADAGLHGRWRRPQKFLCALF
jgi:hypothetical protein